MDPRVLADDHELREHRVQVNEVDAFQKFDFPSAIREVGLDGLPILVVVPVDNS